MSLEKMTRPYREYLEEYLANYYGAFHEEPQKKLFEAMEYSLLGGGKRLRPVFTFAFCQMCGKDWKQAAPFAAAVEMIQTYSLIHDDLPCMDNDDFRRGRPTNHKVYGEAVAVLAGDGLLTAAFSSLAKAELPAQNRIQAVEILSRCAGELGMVGGQVLDMESESRQCTQQEVLDIQSRKTGALIRGACMLGVVAAGGSREQLAAAGEFADHFGLAFQIRDDMLDVIGDKATLGKAVGTDGVKNTFVQLYGLEACDGLVQAHTQKAIDALSVFPDNGYIKWLCQTLVHRYA